MRALVVMVVTGVCAPLRCVAQSCGALPSGAAFRVSSASPTYTCSLASGPQSEAQGTCYTINSGMCITDGVSTSYGNNERCSISVLRSGTLYVSGVLALESCCDGFRVPSTSGLLNTYSELNGVQVTAGQVITWSSDFSVVGTGYVLCLTPEPTSSPPPTSPTKAPTNPGESAAPTPTPAPLMPGCLPLASDAALQVTAATPAMLCGGVGGGGGPQSETQGPCYTTNSGTCVTDGSGSYGNNERCTITVLRSGTLYISGTLSLESGYDGFTIDSSTTLLDTSTELNGFPVTAGQNINWRSDGSVTRSGYVAMRHGCHSYPRRGFASCLWWWWWWW